MTNPVGRPPKYKTPEEMQEAIDAYFAECNEKGEHYTVTGLALALDLTRQGLIEYSQKEDGKFSDTVKRAKLRVENYIEKKLYEPSSTGCIFNLKNNFEWKDKSEVDQNLGGQNGNPIQQEHTIKATPEQLESLKQYVIMKTTNGTDAEAIQ